MQKSRTLNKVQINEHEEHNVTNFQKQIDYQKTSFQKKNSMWKTTNIDQMLSPVLQPLLETLGFWGLLWFKQKYVKLFV